MQRSRKTGGNGRRKLGHADVTYSSSLAPCGGSTPKGGWGAHLLCATKLSAKTIPPYRRKNGGPHRLRKSSATHSRHRAFALLWLKPIKNGGRKNTTNPRPSPLPLPQICPAPQEEFHWAVGEFFAPQTGKGDCEQSHQQGDADRYACAEFGVQAEAVSIENQGH